MLVKNSHSLPNLPIRLSTHQWTVPLESNRRKSFSLIISKMRGNVYTILPSTLTYTRVIDLSRGLSYLKFKVGARGKKRGQNLNNRIHWIILYRGKRQREKERGGEGKLYRYNKVEHLFSKGKIRRKGYKKIFFLPDAKENPRRATEEEKWKGKEKKYRWRRVYGSGEMSEGQRNSILASS